MSRQANILMSFLLGLLGTAIVLASGLLAYRHLSSEKTPESHVNRGSAEIEQSDFLENTNRAKVESASEQTLENLDQVGSDYTRGVALRSMLATAEEPRVLDLIDQSKELLTIGGHLFIQGQVFRRYAALDTKKALAQASEVPQIERGHLVSAEFREWVVTDANAAIQQAKKLDHFDQRIAVEAILQFKEDLDYDQFADISQEVGHKDIGDKYRKRFAIVKSIADFRSEFTLLSSNSR